MRFTVDGSDALESQINHDMDVVRKAVVAAVGNEITGLALGGGYGRGEGGVYVVDGQERVYNDYDFFVVVPYTSRGRRRQVSRALADVKALVEPGCGIHVDFSPPMPESALPRQPYELMFMELRAGHHVVVGAADLLQGLPAFDERCPPLEEGARLFMNRGVGLAMARQILARDGTLNQEDHEFVVRNIYKALMAAGDSVLFQQGNYSPSYVERLRRVEDADLSALPFGEELRTCYRQAIAFKLRPEHTVPGGMGIGDWHKATVALFGAAFLWYERHRLKRPTLSWSAYSELPARLPELSQQDRLKNAVRNIRTRTGALPPVQEWFLHPRDRILKRLPGTLFADNDGGDDFSQIVQLWNNYG